MAGRRLLAVFDAAIARVPGRTADLAPANAPAPEGELR